MDELNAASDRGAEADAVISAENVVVHRLRNGDDFDAFTMQTLAVAERIIAADGNQDSYAEVLEILEHVRSEIPRPRFGVFDVRRIAQKLRFILRLYLRRICSAGVQHCATAAINGANRLLIERQEMLAEAFGLLRVEFEQASP